VIMPFADSFDTIFNEGVHALSIPGHKLVIRRADMSLKGLRLVEHVHRHIEDADFCIADITGANPNVMYEIGFAQALKKEVIVIRQVGGDLPVDISDRYIFDYAQDDLEALTQQLARGVLQAIKIQQSEQRVIKDSYPVTCFRSRHQADINSAIDSAESHFDILETNLSAICDNYLSRILASLERHRELRVRVLTLDPESYFVARRAEQLGVNTAQHRQDLQRSIGKMLTARTKYRDRFTVRTYDTFPTQITFIVDEVVYACTMAMTYRSRDLCTFRLRRSDSGSEKSFVFHFDTLWKEGTEIPHRVVIREAPSDDELSHEVDG